MKKMIFAVGFIMFLFISLAGLANNPNFSAIQNQNSQVQVKLTHQATTIYQMTSFDLPNAQYLTTEGNDTITLAKEYPGAYSFTGDTVNGHPAGWTVHEEVGSDLHVAAEYGNHSKVTYMYGIASGKYCEMYNTFTGQDNATIELWLLSYSDTDDNLEIEFWQGGANQGIYVWFDFGASVAQTYTDHWITLQGIVSHRWYHLRVDFSCTLNKYNVTIDKVQKATNLAFKMPATSIDKLTLRSNGDLHLASTFYVDAIDYSWADDYTLNRNYNESYVTAGSYISPTIDLGVANNYFYNSLTSYVDIPSDSDLDLQTRFSFDNITWTGFSSTPLNYTVGAEIARYTQFLLNFTASSDFLETPAFFGLDINWTGTVLNEYPSIEDIAPANNSINLNRAVPINCSVFDADSDLMNVSLYVNDTLVNSASNCANGSFFYYLFHGNYSTTYAFYFEVSDGENTTISSLYLFSTEDALILPIIGDITVTFDNETMYATIAFQVSDLDNDTLSVFLCSLLGDIVATEDNVTSGDTVQIMVLCNYSTSYTYYVNVTDGENSVQSSTFSFSTGAEPEVPEGTAFPLSYSIAVVFATAAAIFLLSPHGKVESVKSERSRPSRRTRFLMLIVSLIAMGCNSPSSFNLFEGAKNNQNEMV